MDENIKEFMRKLRKMPDFNRVKFVILYGSQALGKANKMSDYDFAIFYEGDSGERFKFRIKLSYNELFDVQMFQDLPLFVQKDVFKGRVLYAKNLTFVYDVAYETIKRFEDFKRYYYDYIKTRRLKYEAGKNRA